MLAILGGLSVLLLVGQALARQTALESTDYPLLLSLGMTRRQLFAFAMVRVAPVALVAGALAFGIAVALSPLAPIGVARSAEPDPGLALVRAGQRRRRGDGPLVFLAALVPAWRASWTGRMTLGGGLARVGFLARSGFPDPACLVCAWRSSPVAAGPPCPRSTLLAASSASPPYRHVHDHRERGSPARHAQVVRPHWDAVIGVGTESSFPALVTACGTIQGSRAGAGTVDEIRIGGKATGVLAMKSIRGALSPNRAGRPTPGPVSEIFWARRQRTRWRPRSETRSRGASATGRPHFAW